MIGWSRRAAAAAGAIALLLGAGACGAHDTAPPSSARTTAPWPPVVTGSYGPHPFCPLLVDAYQHLGSAQRVATPSAKAAIVRGFATFVPTLEAAAPPPVQAPVVAYFGPMTAFLFALSDANMDLARVPAPVLAAIEAPQVGQAQGRLVAFARARCHYDPETAGGSGR